MPLETPQAPHSKGALWTGRVMSTLAALFMLFDGAMKLVKPDKVVEATTQLGFPESVILPLGVVLLVATVAYLVPQTSVLGAILLTGYLGGAVAAHVRHEDGLFPIFFPVIFGALVWGGLVLRCPRLRSVVFGGMGERRSFKQI
jgi:DoxX-like family